MVNEVATQNNKPASLQALATSAKVKERFNEVLGKKAPAFISSLISVANNNEMLAKADPNTIIAAGAMAATFDLPVNQNLGFAWIIPFKNRKKGITEAQFQLGYKGYIQLAMRSGQYKAINAAAVYEGEIKNVNRFTGEYEFGQKTSNKVIGYMAYFKLVNGFEKYLYMSLEEMQDHAKKYSKGYTGGTEKWGLADFDSMAIKTVLKRLISKYGILSIEMQNMSRALEVDGAVIRDNNGELTPDFEGQTIDVQSDVAETIANNANSEAIDIDPGNVSEFVNPETGEAVSMFGD